MGVLGVYSTPVSVPNGQSGHGFEKPGPVRLKLLTAAKGCRRPYNRQVERTGNPQMPRQTLQIPDKAARYLDNEYCSRTTQD